MISQITPQITPQIIEDNKQKNYKELNKVLLSLMASYFHFKSSINDNFMLGSALIILMLSISSYKEKLRILIVNPLSYFKVSETNYIIPEEFRNLSVSSQFEKSVITTMGQASRKYLIPAVNKITPYFLYIYNEFFKNNYQPGIYLSIRGGLATHLLVNGTFNSNIKIYTDYYTSNLNRSLDIFQYVIFNNIFKDVSLMEADYKNVKTNDLDLNLYYNPDVVTTDSINVAVTAILDELVTNWPLIMRGNDIPLSLKRTGPHVFPDRILYQLILSYSLSIKEPVKQLLNEEHDINITAEHHVLEINIVPNTNITADLNKDVEYFYSKGEQAIHLADATNPSNILIHSRDRLIKEYKDIVSKEQKTWYRSHKYLRRILALTGSYPALEAISAPNTVSKKQMFNALNYEFQE